MQYKPLFSANGHCVHNSEEFSANDHCVHKLEEFSANGHCVHNSEEFSASNHCVHNSEEFSANDNCVHNSEESVNKNLGYCMVQSFKKYKLKGLWDLSLQVLRFNIV